MEKNYVFRYSGYFNDYYFFFLLNVEMKTANTKNEGTVKSLWQQF